MPLQRQKELLSSWGKGYLGKGVPRLNYPTDALIDGYDVVLADGGLRTRPGYGSITGSLPDGEVMWLGQVRFPTNEVSYMLAQVKDPQPVTNEVSSFFSAWYNNFMSWLPDEAVLFNVTYCGPGYLYKYWRYDPDADSVSEISPGAYGQTMHGAVYLPTSNEMFCFTLSSVLFAGKILDLDTGQWGTTWSGSSPGGSSGNDRCSAFLRSGKVIICRNERIYEADVTTKAISFFSNEGGVTSGAPYSEAWITYDEVGDQMWLVLLKYSAGYSTILKKYDFDTDTWSTVGTYAGLTPSDSQTRIMFCSDQVLLFQVNSYTASMVILDCLTGAMTTESIPSTVFPDDTYAVKSALVDDAGTFRVLAYGTGPLTIFGNPYGCTFVDGSNVRLYAAPDQLPATSLTWEQIYDLGSDAGVISVSTLGDRCIITEANHVVEPLVWMGCLSDDGSDWAYPKHVLAFANGEQAYDISQYVLDKDQDNSADIGGIDIEGFIDIVTDVPDVEAFYFEMGTANTGMGSAQAYSMYQLFTDVTDVAKQDLKGDIVGWVRDDVDTNLDAAAAVDKENGTVGIPCTGHPFAAEDVVFFSGTTNYNGAFILTDATTANELVIETTYVAETFDGSDVVRANKSTGHFEGITLYIDAAAAVDKGGGLVGIPLTGQPYATGDQIEIRGTTNYDGTYAVDASSSANEIVITASYVGETFGGTETVNQRLTLGAGNDVPSVVVGLQLLVGGAYKTILVITDDGEADDEVELSSATDTGTVTAVYGMNVIDDAVCTNYGYDEGLNELVMDADGRAMYRGYSIRLIIDGADLGSDRDNPRFIFRHYHYTRILHASIGERDGSTANTLATPTEITFNGGESGYLDDREVDYPDYTAYDITSDILKDFTLETTKQYILTLDMGSDFTSVLRSYVTTGTSGSIGVSAALYYDAGEYLMRSFDGHGYYFKTATESWDDDTVTGFTSVASGCVGLRKIQSQELFPVYSTTRVVGHTTDTSRQLIWYIEQLTSVTVDQVTPGSSTLYHACSLDGRNTFQVFKSAAWRDIVQYDSVWKYNTSATATPSWSAASTNTLLGALYDAFGVAYNQWTKTEIEAMDADDWGDTGGIVLGATLYLDWAWSMQANGTDVPKLTSYLIRYLDTGSALVEGFVSGDWSAGSGWTDGTDVGGVPLAQDGAIEYAGTTPFSADYHILDQIPGYHYRLKMLGTSSTASITRLQYKAPCQPLRNIANGQPEDPLAFLWYDADGGDVVDYTALVTDETYTEIYSAPTPLDENRYVYVGCLTKFTAVELIPFEANTTVATLSAQYWTGTTWAALTIVDGTKDAGKPFAVRGMISWTVPSDWKDSVPFDGDYYRGYYVRFTVNAAFYADTAIAEARVYPYPPDLVKHREVATFRDRVALISRPDYGDMVEISRQYQEYGFYGQDAAQYRIGGSDGIQCVVAAWNGLLLGKPETWHYLTGSSPSDFAWTTIEAARHIPINSRVIVKAPIDSQDGLRHGLFFLNQFGAFALSGLQADTAFATARAVELGTHANWWDEGADEHLDIGALASTGCGAYWPRKNWVVWAVPMVLTGQSAQSTNNRLLVYDLTLGAWLRPFRISVASLCTAYHYDADTPGRIADVGLYAGGYNGNILRLFAGSATSDDGTVIAFNAKTGLISFGSPGIDKELVYVRIFGTTAGSGTVKIYRNSESTPFRTLSLTKTVNPSNKEIDVDFYGNNKKFRYLQLEVDAVGVTEIDAIEIHYLMSYPIEGQG